jgi:hypothetical protein
MFVNRKRVHLVHWPSGHVPIRTACGKDVSRVETSQMIGDITCHRCMRIREADPKWWEIPEDPEYYYRKPGRLSRAFERKRKEKAE